MSDTPRTDAFLKTHDCGNEPSAYYSDDWSSFDIEELVKHSRQLERELNEALKWKNEDPRMLREQIRVADAAYQFLHKEHDQLKAQVQIMYADLDAIIQKQINSKEVGQ